ncbi:uncharacterized protein A1O9_08408 [Exophiala aquamarina CBS 119918]|uniref:Uncharacterized protein n=1 Tax=Exophiala aquamarina CBS 119918 TaxID=1182545 RepID=A0A072P8Q4_9EURO|nr:uncharacterized protein A1O9_08408 [Exophiala aquamarina CBS 119918]KEF55658.1 hypothetical protein A1O9_08408 [Exophiala aquamarina CBS 119918]
MDTHPNYELRPVDLENWSIDDITKAFEGLDTLHRVVDAFWGEIVATNAHITYMYHRMGHDPRVPGIWTYRNARLALLEGRDTPEARWAWENYEKQVIENDNAKTFIAA